ncbi:transcriptional regulator [Escherichia coli]|nr:transcriptional regulator [Escherichia coli]
MSEVIRNDIFHFASKKNVPTGFYRLCKQKPVNPLFFLPNLLVVAESNNDAVLPCWICPYISRHLLSLNPLLACCRRYSRGER